MCRKQHRDVFFAYHGPGPWECFFCKEKVVGWWDMPPDSAGHTRDLRRSDAHVVHHIDGDHENNDPKNLTASHYGCHTRFHKSANPLVPKGGVLPAEWRAKQAAASARRMATMTPEQKAQWLQRTVAGMAQVDKTPTICDDCGKTFKGKHGLGIHRARFHDGVAQRSVDQLDRTWSECIGCGRSFRGPSVLKMHQTRMGCK